VGRRGLWPGLLLALLILPSPCEARTPTTVAALARQAIGNCHQDDTVEGVAVSDARGGGMVASVAVWSSAVSSARASYIVKGVVRSGAIWMREESS
jgi:hypothetical protein